MRNTEERLRKRREKRAIFVSKNEGKNTAKRRRRGDDERRPHRRALVLVHTHIYIHITREVCVIAFFVLLRAPRMMNVHKKRICT